MARERYLPLLFRQEAVLKSPHIARLNQLSRSYLEQQQVFKALYPADDVRPWTFQKIAQILAYYRLSLEYTTGILSRTDNLSKILEPARGLVVSAESGGAILREYEQYITFSFFHVVFSSFESSMRCIVGKVPVTNSRGKPCRETAKFYDIYHGLIDVAGLDDQYRTLFELLLMMRNCIHNRSVYFSDKGSRSIVYKGVSYDFVNGKPVTFATISVFFDLLMDIRDFFIALYRSPRLTEEAHIPDNVL